MGESKGALITFNPYIGDTMLAAALAKQIQVFNGESPIVLTYDKSSNECFLRYFCDLDTYGMDGSNVTAFLNEGKVFQKQTPLKKIFFKGNYEYYFPSPDTQYLSFLEGIVADILDSMAVQFDQFSVYTFHYSFPHAFLAREAHKRGVPVFGYILDENNNLKMLNFRGEWLNAEIWTNEFIGQRLSRLFLGVDLTPDSFTINIEPEERIFYPKQVVLFPGTRGNRLPTAGHWDVDCEYLQRQGFTVKVLAHQNDQIDEEVFLRTGADVERFTSLYTMVQEICKANFIICNDSVAFHLAWYYGVPAVVKLKGGFNYEWVPDWVRDSSYYKYIPPIMMYEEEYLHLLDYHVSDLRDSIRTYGQPSRRLIFFDK